ncbi:MAG: DUF5687 family protein [Bacteroidota bacterium]
MNRFYLKHHYLSIVRNPSFGGEVFAIILLFLFLLSLSPLIYSELENYVVNTAELFAATNGAYGLFLSLYISVDLILKQIFRRPTPKIKYYNLLGDFSHSISWQYLITSLFGILPFVFFMPCCVVAYKAATWFDWTDAALLIFWWLINHSLGIWSQFGHKRLNLVFLTLATTFILLQYFLSSFEIWRVLFHPLVVALVLPIVIYCAYSSVRKVLKQKVINPVQAKDPLFLGQLNFKNPLYQLEWTLIARNKRTRSNLLMGLLLIPIFLFNPVYRDSPDLLPMVYFIIINLVAIQHSLYSFGWESSYFDFLVTTISPQQFFIAKWNVMLFSCALGGLLCFISSLFLETNLFLLLLIFIYSVGVNIPLVLFRNHYHDAKIDLSENALFNYNGVLTGPILVSSFATILLPLAIYMVGNAVSDGAGGLALGAFGLVGVLARKQIILILSRKFSKRKLHLSQSFKA